MKRSKIDLKMQYFQLHIIKKINWFLCLLVLILNSSVYAQETDDELPESFYGNWVEDLTECETGSYFSIAESEVGLFVFGLGWSSTEVKVEKMDNYYILLVEAVSEGGDFQSEIKIKMGDNGNLFFIDSDSEEKELVKCEAIEFEEVVELENEEITPEYEGLEVEELELSNTIDEGIVDPELPLPFYGNWVEDLSDCGGVSLLSIDYSVDGVLVSGLDWYSREVKVENMGDVYTLFIKAESEDGEFQSEINIKMGEEGELIIINPESEDAKLVKCELLMQADFPEEELEVESVQLEEIETVEEVVDLEVLVETGVEVEELDMENTTDLEIFDIELLQGTWQSLEDEDSFMVIEGDRMKNYYGGMDEELDNEAIILSDTCMNEADSANGLPEEKNRYLSNPNLDMCWYIEYLDENNLTLIYTARGNKITYRRVE
ncbi:MAG: hypothetical protein ACKO44_00745 [Algoriphagus sp.]